MRHVLAACVVLACAGCSMPAKVAKGPAVASFDSVKSPAQLSGCLVQKYIEQWPLTRIIPKQAGQQVSITADSFGNVVAMVEVDPSDGGGSHAEVKEGTAFSWVLRQIIEKAQSCR